MRSIRPTPFGRSQRGWSARPSRPPRAPALCNYIQDFADYLNKTFMPPGGMFHVKH